MKWTSVMVLALSGLAMAQTPAAAPSLSDTEQVLVQAVMSAQKDAQLACDALPQVKRYTDLLSKTNAALTKAGKSVDWRTGKPAAIKDAPTP